MTLFSYSFFFLLLRLPPRFPLFPYTTLFRSLVGHRLGFEQRRQEAHARLRGVDECLRAPVLAVEPGGVDERSEEHTSELQSRFDLVCRLLLEKKNSVF